MAVPPRLRLAWGAALGLAVLAVALLVWGAPDRALVELVHRLDPGTLALLAAAAEPGNSRWTLIPSGVLLAVLLALRGRVRRRRPGEAWDWTTAALAFLFATVAASGLLVDLVKWLVGRTRPRLVAEGVPYGFEPLRLAADYQSFPSGHACTLVALALVAGFLAPRLMVPFLALAGVLSLGRIAAGAHYLSDLVGGAAVAVFVACGLRERFAARGWVFAVEGGRLRPARPGRMLGRWLRRRLRRAAGRLAGPGGKARPPAGGGGPGPGRRRWPAPPMH